MRMGCLRDVVDRALDASSRTPPRKVSRASRTPTVGSTPKDPVVEVLSERMAKIRQEVKKLSKASIMEVPAHIDRLLELSSDKVVKPR